MGTIQYGMENPVGKFDIPHSAFQIQHSAFEKIRNPQSNVPDL